MKKVIVLCLILALIVPMLCFSANAEEYTTSYDARNVPDEVAELLPDYEDAQIVYRYYSSLPFRDGVGSIASLEARMTEETERTPYYMVVTADIQKIYKIENGTAVYQNWGEPSRMSNEMLTHEAIYAVSPDICLESIYCVFNYLYAVSTSLIFYKTNLGDYVYFKTEQTQPVLMTVRRYDEYIAAWTEYSEEMLESKGTLMGGRYVLHIDFSAYDWTSPNFDPDAPLPIEKEEPEQEFPWLIVGTGAGVLAVAVNTVLLIRKKKRKTEPEEIGETPEET